MKMQRPLSLSDRQMQLVRNAARAVPVSQRDQFLQNVAARLVDAPSDAAVAAAVNAQLDRVPVFLTDAQPKEKIT